MQRVLVLGAGFVGLWSAIGAARKLDEIGIRPDRVEVTVVDRSAWHSIRVRNYEADLDGTRVPLDEVLRPIGVRRVEAEVADIDFARREVACTGVVQQLPNDRLVFALGSRLARPPIPGLDIYAFDVDTYEAASRLNAHIAALPGRPPSPGRDTVLVIGGRLTGIEAAAEMPVKCTVRSVLMRGRGPASFLPIGNNGLAGIWVRRPARSSTRRWPRSVSRCGRAFASPRSTRRTPR